MSVLLTIWQLADASKPGVSEKWRCCGLTANYLCLRQELHLNPSCYTRCNSWIILNVIRIIFFSYSFMCRSRLICKPLKFNTNSDQNVFLHLKIIHLQNTNFSWAKQQPSLQLLLFYSHNHKKKNSWIGLFFLKKLINWKPNPQNLEIHDFQPAVTKCVRFCIFVLFIYRFLQSTVSFVFCRQRLTKLSRKHCFPSQIFCHHLSECNLFLPRIHEHIWEVLLSIFQFVFLFFSQLKCFQFI